MFQQLDLLEAQLNERPDGSVEILGQSGYLVLKAEYAEKIKTAYQQFLDSHPRIDSLKITVNIEVPQPIGQFVNEG